MLRDLLVEDSEGVGVGEHEARDILVHLCFQGGKIDHAALVAAQIFDLVADHGGSGGIGAVGGVGNQDLFARIAFGFKIGAHQQDAGEFAVGSGGRLQSDGIHAGDFDELIGERLHDAQCALRDLLGLIGMGAGDSIEAGDDLIDPRIVLHGAGAERVHAVIDRVIPGGEAGEVADDFDLADFRQRGGFGAQCGAEFGGGIDFGHIERAQAIGFLAGRGVLEDEALVLRDMGADLADILVAHSVHLAGARQSMAARDVSSVAHQTAALPSSG